MCNLILPGNMKKLIILVICLVITIIYPEMGTLIATSCCNLFGIGWLYIHHAVQLLLALATILLLVLVFQQKPLSKWGFNLNNYKWSLSTVLKFAAGWIIVTIVLNILFSFGSHIDYEKNFINISADLFLTLFLQAYQKRYFFEVL